MRHIEPEFFPLCQQEGLAMITWSPLGGGFLSGKYRKRTQPPSQGRIAGVEKRPGYRGGEVGGFLAEKGHSAEFPYP